MKKFLFVAALVGISGLAQAVTINATSGSSTIDGNFAYEWGVSIAVPTGQSIASAQIDFTSVTLTAANSSGTGFLYTDLLNSKTPGITAQVDGDVSGDYWATKFSGANITTLGTEFFKKVNTTLSWSYILTGNQIVALNNYLVNNAGIFDIGIDPDCRYTVGNIAFTYTLSPANTPHTVPDAAYTAFLLMFGLAGLEIFRRQFVLAKIKA